MFRQFPIAVVDNFFDDPYKIRKFALSCEYTKAPGNYPGERTKMLSEIYPKYFNSFCNRLFSLFYYYEPNPNVVWNVETMFQKIYPLDDDKLSPLNSGWIHSSQLRPSKSLITTSQKILFKKPTKYSKPIAKLDVGRLLLVRKCEKSWCNVKTGKHSGWIDQTDIWGKAN